MNSGNSYRWTSWPTVIAGIVMTCAGAQAQEPADQSTQNVRGELEIRGLFNEALDVDVSASVKKSSLVYLTGDAFTTEGDVVALRLGTHICKLIEGKLWKFPLIVGNRGKARVNCDGVETDGTIAWEIASADASSLTIKADVFIPYYHTMSLYFHSGSWTANYTGQKWLPDTTRLKVSGFQTRREDTRTVLRLGS